MADRHRPTTVRELLQDESRSWDSLPQIDLPSVRNGAADELCEAMLALAGGWLNAARYPLSTAINPSEVVRLGVVPAAGLLAAGLDLLRLLSESPQGRQAMRKFGVPPVAEYVEREEGAELQSDGAGGATSSDAPRPATGRP